MSFGARLVPLNYNLTDSQLKSEMHKLNGVIFTGGGLTLCSNNGKFTDWTIKAKRVFDYALQFND